MSSDATGKTLENIQDITGREPTLYHLDIAKDFWHELQRYWEILFDEAQMRIDGHLTIRIIDFDVIYPACWPTPLRRPYTFESGFGFPVTAAYVFRKTKLPFTIPHGALAELIRYLIQLEKEYLTAGSNLERLFRDTTVSNTSEINKLSYQARYSYQDNYQTKTVSEEEVKKDILKLSERGVVVECKQDVDTLIESGARLHGLKGVLNHPFHKTWSEVADQAEISIDPSDVLKYQRIFNARRKYTMSNYLDALNVVSYDTLLNNGLARISAMSGAEPDQVGGSSKAILPLLATSTRMILNEESIRRRQTVSQHYSSGKEQISPVPTQYLSFATVIEEHAENDDRRVRSIALNGLDHVIKLLRAYRAFRGDWSVGNLIKQRDTKKVRLAELAGLSSFQDFSAAYQQWNSRLLRDIRTVFLEIARTDSQLSRSYEVAKNSLSARLSEGYSLAESFGTQELDPSLRWSHLEPIISSSILSQGVGRLTNRNHALQTLRHAGLLEDRNREWLQEPQLTQRITVRLPQVDANLFIWEKTFQCESQLCYWKYRLDMAEILKEVRQFLLSNGSLEKGENLISLNIYGVRDNLANVESIYAEKTIDANLPFEQWVEELRSVTDEVEYVRIEAESCTIYFDLIPTSQSIGLELAVMYEELDLHERVADLYQNTAVTPLDPLLVASLLQEYVDNFEAEALEFLRLQAA